MLSVLFIPFCLTHASQIVRLDSLVPSLRDEVRVNAYGDIERIAEEEVPVSLLQTALQHSRSVVTADSTPSQISARKASDSGDENVLLQEEMHFVKSIPVLKPAKTAKTLQKMHTVLSMSPGGMFAATAGAMVRKSPFALPKIGDSASFVDTLTLTSWSYTIYAQLLVIGVAALFFVVQSFTGDDLLAHPRKLKKQETQTPFAEAQLSLGSATKFVVHAGSGGVMEIHGPVGCPALRVVISQECGRRILSICSMTNGSEPLITVGPLLDKSVPQSVRVCRMSTGAVSCLEPSSAGQWVLRRDGISVFTIKCNIQQQTLEMMVPTVMRESDKSDDEFPLDEDDQASEKDDLRAGRVYQLAHRIVAHASLRHCDVGPAFNFDAVELSIASGDEVVMPLACMLATISMLPEVFASSASS